MASDSNFCLDHIFTEQSLALESLLRRREDSVLVRSVNQYLSGDIPQPFISSRPIFYLARHLATPCFETLHAIELARGHNAILVIGQDSKSKFVSHNELKHALGRLSFVVGRDRNGNDIVTKKRVIDFSSAGGKALSSVQTLFGASLTAVHQALMSPFLTDDVKVFEECEWIDRWARNDIHHQYRRMLSFACVNAIMLEWFTETEHDFARQVILPAFNAIQNVFGVRPLVVRLVPTCRAHESHWLAYPGAVKDMLRSINNIE